MVFTWEYNSDKTLKRATLLQTENITLSDNENVTITLKSGSVSAWMPTNCEMDNSSWISAGIVVLGVCSFSNNSFAFNFGGNATITNVVAKNNVKFSFCKNTKTSIVDCSFEDDCSFFAINNDCFLNKSRFSKNVNLRDCNKITSSNFKNFVSVQDNVVIDGASIRDFSDIGSNVVISGVFSISESIISNGAYLSSEFFGIVAKTLINNKIKIKGNNICIKNSNIDSNILILGDVILENSSIKGENGTIKIDTSKHVGMSLFLRDANISSQYDFFIYKTNKDEIVAIYTNAKGELIYCSKETEKAIDIVCQLKKTNASVREPFKNDKYMGWARWFVGILKNTQADGNKTVEEKELKEYLDFQKKILFDVFGEDKIKDIKFLTEIILWNTVEFLFAVCSAQYPQQKYNISSTFNISMIKFTGAILSEGIKIDLKNKKVHYAPMVFLNEKTIELLSGKLSLPKEEIIKKIKEKSIIMY